MTEIGKIYFPLIVTGGNQVDEANYQIVVEVERRETGLSHRGHHNHMRDLGTLFDACQMPFNTGKLHCSLPRRRQLKCKLLVMLNVKSMVFRKLEICHN